MKWQLWLLLVAFTACAPTTPPQWVPYRKGLPTHTTVLALAVDPQEARRIVAGAYDTTGAYISDDGARTWRVFSDGLDNLPVLALQFAKNNLFAGTTAGLYHLRGNRWTRTDDVPPVAIYSIVVAPDGTLYIATDTRGVFASADSGETWTPIQGLDGEILLCVVALDSTTLIAGTSGHGAFITHDHGATWQPITRFGGEFVSLVMLDPRDGRTLYLRTRSGLFRSRDGAQTWDSLIENVVVDAFLIHGNRLYAATSARGVLTSDDEGASWQTSGIGLPDGVGMLALAPLDAQTILVGAQNGIYVTRDAGNTWQTTNQGLGTPQVHALALDPSDRMLYAAAEDGLYRAEAPEDFQLVAADELNAPVLSLAFAPQTPGMLYAGTSRRGIFVSRDAGASWRPVGDLFAGRLSVPGILVDDLNDETLWARVLFGRLYKSSDAGDNWHAVWSGMPDQVEVETMLRVPADSTRMYAGTSDGLYYSTDRGETWTGRGLAPRTVFALWSDPRDARALLAGTTDGIYRSPDAGATWNASGLEHRTVTSIVPAPNGDLYVGTKYNGVWMRRAGQMNWTRPGTGLEDVSVNALVLDSNRNRLYAATSLGLFQVSPMAPGANE